MSRGWANAASIFSFRYNELSKDIYLIGLYISSPFPQPTYVHVPRFAHLYVSRFQYLQAKVFFSVPEYGVYVLDRQQCGLLQ